MQKNASFAEKNVKGKTDAPCDALYRADFEVCLESVVHPVEKYVGGEENPL